MNGGIILHSSEGPDEGYDQEKPQPVNAPVPFEKTAVDICGAKHPTGWWITCQLEPDHFGEHVRDCAPVEVGERLMFSQYTVHWQDPCECDSHTGVGEDLWKCDECGEVVRYVDDANGGLTLTELHPYRNRKVRVELVTPGDRPGNREWWS